MEERSENTIQTNDENRDQSIDQMFVAICVQESLELIEDCFNIWTFVDQKNRHEEGNPNGNMQTNNNNHDNLNNNEVDEINITTNSRQNNQNENQDKFYWNGVADAQLTNELDNAYEKIVYLKRNLFMLPSGAAGKNCIEEVKLHKWYTTKKIALKVTHAMLALMFQKPPKSSKSKDHRVPLKRRLKLWEKG